MDKRLLTKEKIDSWYDSGQKPLTIQQKKDLEDLVVSWNDVIKKFQRLKIVIQKIPYPKVSKTRTKEEIMESITGKSWKPVNKEWRDLKIKN